MVTDRFPARPAVPAAPAAPRRLARPLSWLAAVSGSLAALARRLRAALPGGRAGAVPIAVLGDAGDVAGQRRRIAALRMGLRGAERALAGWPDVAITVAVLETVGTPGRVDDLGALVAACRVRHRPDGPRAVIRLAITAGGRPLTDDNRLTALWLTLDWLLDWQPDAGDHFTVPYQPPAAGPAVAAAPPIDLPAVPPLGAAAPPPGGASPAPRARTNGVAAPSPAADRSAPAEPTPAPGDAPPACALPADGLAWPEPDAPED
jgi:hypothetical protein